MSAINFLLSVGVATLVAIGAYVGYRIGRFVEARALLGDDA